MGDVGLDLGRHLGLRPECGMEVVDDVDELDHGDELDGEGAEGRPPLLGRPADLEEAIDAARARSVIVAFGHPASQELVTILRSAVLHDTEVYVVPRFFELGLMPAGPDVELVWGISLARVRRAALRVTAFRLKRAADVVLAALLLVLLSPVLLATAAAVKLSSPGPVLCRQARVGQFGRRIEVLKFRTLSGNDAADVQRTVAPDPRQTRTGGFLRRTSLDELPKALERVAGGHGAGGAPPGTAVLRDPVHRRGAPRRRSAPPSCRPRRPGPGPRPAGRHLDRGTGPVRQLLHRALDPVGGRQDRRCDRVDPRPRRPRRRRPQAPLPRASPRLRSPASSRSGAARPGRCRDRPVRTGPAAGWCGRTRVRPDRRP